MSVNPVPPLNGSRIRSNVRDGFDFLQNEKDRAKENREEGVKHRGERQYQDEKFSYHSQYKTIKLKVFDMNKI